MKGTKITARSHAILLLPEKSLLRMSIKAMIKGKNISKRNINTANS
jgi:hypothetical protein